VAEILGYTIVTLITLGFLNLYLIVLRDLNKEEKLSFSQWIDIAGHYDLLKRYKGLCESKNDFPIWYWVQIMIGGMAIVAFVLLVRS
jgi:hypothetical protein